MKVRKGEFFPSDLVLLRSSEPKNVCMVETKNLDGETNLKHKIAPKALFDMFTDHIEMIENLRGMVKCEPPNDKIYSFEGII